MTDEKTDGRLSPWWARTVILVLLAGFSVLILVADLAYRDAPPIPEKIVTTSGKALLTGQEILAGQKVFEKYGIMENGTLWGHGAYLGPDFSAAYLHTLGVEAANTVSQELFGHDMNQLPRGERATVEDKVRLPLKQNRYEPRNHTLVFTDPETGSTKQVGEWTHYFSSPVLNGGLRPDYISDPKELKQLTAFFAWAAWASVVNRPGDSVTYTNNFPYDPLVGNTPPSDAVLWSAISLIALLVGTALVLFCLRQIRLPRLEGTRPHIHPQMLPGRPARLRERPSSFSLWFPSFFWCKCLLAGRPNISGLSGKLLWDSFI